MLSKNKQSTVTTTKSRYAIRITNDSISTIQKFANIIFDDKEFQISAEMQTNEVYIMPANFVDEPAEGLLVSVHPQFELISRLIDTIALLQNNNISLTMDRQDLVVETKSELHYSKQSIDKFEFHLKFMKVCRETPHIDHYHAKDILENIYTKLVDNKNINNRSLLIMSGNVFKNIKMVLEPDGDCGNLLASAKTIVVFLMPSDYAIKLKLSFNNVAIMDLSDFR